MTSALVAGLAAVVALLGILVVGLLRSHAEVLRSLHDLGVNLDPSEVGSQTGAALASANGATSLTPPPLGSGTGRVVDIVGVDPYGSAVQVAITGTRHRTMLAFLSSNCLTCHGFWETFDDPTIELPGKARLVVVTQGPQSESPSKIAELAAPHFRVVLSSEAWQTYGVPGAPYFVLVDGKENKVLGEGAATTWDHVSRLLRRAMADAEMDGGERAALIDGELRAAGIEPGDPSL